MNLCGWWDIRELCQTQVTWCFVPSQPVWLYQGDCQTQNYQQMFLDAGVPNIYICFDFMSYGNWAERKNMLLETILYFFQIHYLNLTNRSYILLTKHLAAFGFPNPKLSSFYTTQSGLPLTSGAIPCIRPSEACALASSFFRLDHSCCAVCCSALCSTIGWSLDFLIFFISFSPDLFCKALHMQMCEFGCVYRH